MTAPFENIGTREQSDLGMVPFDKWVAPDGDVTAMFYRMANGYLVRFPKQADFEIDGDSMKVRCAPADEDSLETAKNLFHNAIVPIIGNHNGGLNMHGSAVRLGETAVAFLGMSRRGKTTLAGAFAKAGHPFLTEDVLGLVLSDGIFHVQPSRPVLRVFRDSAAHLLDGEPGWGEDEDKNMVDASQSLPFCKDSAPLGRIYILGPGESDAVSIEKLSAAEALAQLIQHSFILDVEDKRRLRDHFNRITALAENISCFALDYPRSYDQLPKTIEAIRNACER